MKKFEAVNKRNGKTFVVVMMEDKALTIESESGKEKEVSLATIKRWFELKKEIVPVVEKKEVKEEEVKKEMKEIANELEGVIKKNMKKEKPAAGRKHSRTDVKKDGTVRQDKFKPKLNAEIVSEIKRKIREGAKQSHLAKEYGVSNQTIRCIRFGWMWKEVV
jgi:hypothetical protein